MELLRVPIHEGESVTEQALEIGGERQTYYGWTSTISGVFGCGLSGSPCSCFEGHTGDVVGARLRLRRVWEPVPPDYLSVEPSPVVVLPGQSAPITVTARWADGTVASMADATPVTITAASATYGWLRHFSTSGMSLTVPYRPQGAGGVKFYADPSAQPVCDTPVEITANGGGASGSGTVVVRGTSTVTAPDTLLITSSPSSISHGDSAVVVARALSVDGCDVSPSIPDSTQMAVVVLTAYYGDLEYKGERAPAFFDVPYVDLRNGLVRFVADGADCDTAYVPVLIEGAGVTGATVLTVTGGVVGGRTEPQGFAGSQTACTTDCDCPEGIGLTEPKADIVAWFRRTCAANLTERTISTMYERNLALYLGQFYPGGFGWGSTQGYPQADPEGVDGYGQWAFDAHFNPLTGAWSYTGLGGYVPLLLESKLRGGPPIRSSGDRDQAFRHIDFLQQEYQRMVAEFPGHMQVGRPVLVYMSQNTGSGDRGWWLGKRFVQPDGSYSPDYHTQVLDYARAHGVIVVHAKVATLLGRRSVNFRVMDRFSALDARHPFFGWLLRNASEVDLTGTTWSTLAGLDFDCDVLDDYPAHRVPPGSGP